jgi:hypothetical protein
VGRKKKGGGGRRSGGCVLCYFPVVMRMRVVDRRNGDSRNLLRCSGLETKDAKVSKSCANGEQGAIESVKTRLVCALGRFVERDRIVQVVLYSPFRREVVRTGGGVLSFACVELAGKCRLLLCSMIEEETLVWAAHRSWRGESRWSRGEAGRRRVRSRD